MEAKKQLLSPASGLSAKCLLRSQMGAPATPVLYYSWFQSISMHITDITPCWRMMHIDMSMCIAIKHIKPLFIHQWMLNVLVLQTISNKIHDLKHKHVCTEMFRNLQDLKNFYKLFSSLHSIKLYISNTSHIRLFFVKIVLILSYLVGLNIQLCDVLCFSPVLA